MINFLSFSSNENDLIFPFKPEGYFCCIQASRLAILWVFEKYRATSFFSLCFLMRDMLLFELFFPYGQNIGLFCI